MEQTKVGKTPPPGKSNLGISAEFRVPIGVGKEKRSAYNHAGISGRSVIEPNEREWAMGSKGTTDLLIIRAAVVAVPMPARGERGGGGGSGGGGGGDQCELAITTWPWKRSVRQNTSKATAECPAWARKCGFGKSWWVRGLRSRQLGRRGTRACRDQYNYLRQCMSRGLRVIGTVVSSSAGPLPGVSVDLTPTK